MTPRLVLINPSLDVFRNMISESKCILFFSNKVLCTPYLRTFNLGGLWRVMEEKEIDIIKGNLTLGRLSNIGSW